MPIFRAGVVQYKADECKIVQKFKVRVKSTISTTPKSPKGDFNSHKNTDNSPL